MKVKEWVDGGLILDGNILDGAEEAFKDSRYVEAFALIHALIDWWMIDLYQMHEASKRGYTLEVMQELHSKHEYRFRKSLKYLLMNEIINQQEYERLKKFDELRNKIIHCLVIYLYQPYKRYRVTKTEVIQGFEEGKALVDLLSSKTTMLGWP